MAVFDLKNKACIVGVGTSEKFGFVLDKSPVALQVESFKAALEDAGLRREDIDGFNTAHGSPIGVDYDEFAALSGCTFRWVNQNWTHGRWTGTSVVHSAFAVCAGLANYVAITNTYINRRGYGRYFSREGGSGEALRDAGGGHGEVAYVGLDTPVAGTAMAARKYFLKYGATSEELGTVGMTFRKHASLNPMAILRTPFTLEEYMNSRMIVDPLHILDCCLVNEGSVTMIVTTADRARHLKKKPVYISGHQGIPANRDNFHLFARPGLGLTAFGEEYDYKPEDNRVYEMAGVTQKDIDALYLYDSFSPTTWMVLERFGFCPMGEAHSWTQGGRIEVGGELPINTNGGMMSEGDYTGYAHVIEMVRQLRNECGQRQVKGAEVVQWATPWGDSLILTKG